MRKLRLTLTRAITCSALLFSAVPRYLSIPIEDPIPNVPIHSVSGFSAGASVAVNHLIAFSTHVSGIGIIGGSPYGCNILPNSGNTCSGWDNSGQNRENKSIPWNDFLQKCTGYVNSRAAHGLIDPLENLNTRPVYLFSGIDDVTVYQQVMKAVASQFRNLTSALKTEFSFHADHAWIVNSEFCKHPNVPREQNACCGFKNSSTSCPFPGIPGTDFSAEGCCGFCGTGSLYDGTYWRPPINSCGYDMSGELLRWILGDGAVKPAAAANAVSTTRLYQVNQSKFLPLGWTLHSALLDSIGFIYAPTSCTSTAAAWPKDPEKWPCHVHLHYHPCGGSYRDVSTAYMMQIALPNYAESNDMVILYPQTGYDNNPAGAGCWDWFGATSAEFDTHNGAQLRFALNMMADLPHVLSRLHLDASLDK
eukprot:m.198169 g.198169  ORF g.198169 m.198169 type:complete len:420 (+) comp18738_c0_seq1:81-1340(+)